MALSQVNTLGLSEKAGIFTFPAEDSVKSIIPLWMHFFAFEYSNTATTRALSNTSVGGLISNHFPAAPLKAHIAIPAPINFETTTAHVYKNQTTVAQTIIPKGIQDLIGKGIERLNRSKFMQSRGFNIDLDKARAKAETYMTGANRLIGNYSGYGSDIPVDDNDAVFAPSGPSRVFEVRLTMPCLSSADSVSAGRIINAFEAYSLPTVQSLFSLTSTKFFHPPLWVFGIGNIDGTMDPEWSGQPLLCALQTVKAKRSAFDTNSLAAIEDGFKPVGYSLSLVFKEIEPAVRLLNVGGQGSAVITNRSGAMVRGGLGSVGSVNIL